MSLGLLLAASIALGAPGGPVQLPGGIPRLKLGGQVPQLYPMIVAHRVRKALVLPPGLSPEAAARRTCVVLVVIDAEGHFNIAELKVGSGDPDFDAAVMAAVESFVPGGSKVPTATNQKIRERAMNQGLTLRIRPLRPRQPNLARKAKR